MAYRMQTKRKIKDVCTYTQDMLGRISEDQHPTIHAAVEALEWVLEPWPGTKQRMKTRARIEEILSAIRKALETEKEVILRQRQLDTIRALEWVLGYPYFHAVTIRLGKALQL